MFADNNPHLENQRWKDSSEGDSWLHSGHLHPLPTIPTPSCWVWAWQGSFSLRVIPGKCYTSIELILFGPEKKKNKPKKIQADILQVSGSSALWSHGTIQDPLCWLPASNSCNENQIFQIVVKYNFVKEGPQAAAVPSAGHHQRAPVFSGTSQSLFADCGELFACSSVYLQHVLSNYYQLLREITKDLPSTCDLP